MICALHIQHNRLTKVCLGLNSKRDFTGHLVLRSLGVSQRPEELVRHGGGARHGDSLQRIL